MHQDWRDVTIGDGPPISSSVSEAETERLAALAAGRDVLEVGSAYGYSAIVMALAGARVTAVDVHTWIPGSCEAMAANLAAYGVTDRVEILRVPSQEALPALAAAGRRFGLVFIDGDHGAAAVRHDVEQSVKLLEPGGALAVHDYGEDCHCPDVRPVLDEMFPAGGEVTCTLFVVTS